MFFVSAVGEALARSPPTWNSPEQHLPSFLAVCPPPHWTGRGPGNEGTMFGELRVLFVFFLFFFFFFFFFF